MSFYCLGELCARRTRFGAFTRSARGDVRCGTSARRAEQCGAAQLSSSSFLAFAFAFAMAGEPDDERGRTRTRARNNSGRANEPSGQEDARVRLYCATQAAVNSRNRKRASLDLRPATFFAVVGLLDVALRKRLARPLLARNKAARTIFHKRQINCRRRRSCCACQTRHFCAANLSLRNTRRRVILRVCAHSKQTNAQ